MNSDSYILLGWIFGSIWSLLWWHTDWEAVLANVITLIIMICLLEWYLRRVKKIGDALVSGEEQ